MLYHIHSPGLYFLQCKQIQKCLADVQRLHLCILLYNTKHYFTQTFPNNIGIKQIEIKCYTSPRKNKIRMFLSQVVMMYCRELKSAATQLFSPPAEPLNVQCCVSFHTANSAFIVGQTLGAPCWYNVKVEHHPYDFFMILKLFTISIHFRTL